MEGDDIMKSFEIMFNDLTEEAQSRLLGKFNTTPGQENWDIFPIATINREEGRDENV